MEEPIGTFGGVKMTPPKSPTVLRKSMAYHRVRSNGMGRGCPGAGCEHPPFFMPESGTIAGQNDRTKEKGLSCYCLRERSHRFCKVDFS